MKSKPVLLKNHGRTIAHGVVGGRASSFFAESATSGGQPAEEPQAPASGSGRVLELAARLEAEGNPAGAAAAYRSALKQDPGHAEAQAGLDRVAEAAEAQEVAFAAARQEEEERSAAEAAAASLSPRGFRHASGRGYVSETLSQIAAEKGSAHKAASSKESAAKNLKLGLALQSEGDLAGAESALRAAVGFDPQLADAHSSLAMVLKERGEVDGALAGCRAALEVLQSSPARARLQHRLGALLQDEGRLEEAAAAYQAALLLDPTMDGAHFNLGTVLQQRGDLQGAVEAYQGALSRDRSHAGAQHNLGLALAQLGDLDAAAAAFRVAADLDPSSASARNNLGNVLVRLDDLEGAALAFRAALELDSGMASAHDNLGAVLFELGDLDAAAGAFQAALAVDPRMADAHTHLGQLLRDRGEFGSAAEAFQEALKVDPSQAAVHCDLGLALKMMGDLKGAIESFSRALDLDPGNPEMRSTYEELLKEERKSQGSGSKPQAAGRDGGAARVRNLDYSRFDNIDSDTD